MLAQQRLRRAPWRLHKGSVEAPRWFHDVFAVSLADPRRLCSGSKLIPRLNGCYPMGPGWHHGETVAAPLRQFGDSFSAAWGLHGGSIASTQQFYSGDSALALQQFPSDSKAVPQWVFVDYVAVPLCLIGASKVDPPWLPCGFIDFLQWLRYSSTAAHQCLRGGSI